MGQQIGAAGQGLPVGQFTNPPSLQTSVNNLPGNSLTLYPGDRFPVAPGSYLIDPGLYSFLQFLDPVTQTWRTFNTSRGRAQRVVSDGQNISVANLLGCPVAAIVTASGGGYAQSTTTVIPSIGNSTWQAIIGGMASVVSIANAGAGYGLPPMVEIAPPPAPGVQATGYAVMQSGTIAGVTLTNVGAGYVTVPEVRLVPAATDPNINVGITAAQVSLALVGGTAANGSIAAILCTNPGVSLASVPSLTISGSGSAGAATAVRLSTFTGLVGGTLTGAGAGYPSGAGLSTVGGRPTATPLWLNPATDLSQFVPRPAMADLGGSGGSLASISSIYDGGIFAGTPAALIVPSGGALQTGAPTLVFALGGVPDTVIIQPAP